MKLAAIDIGSNAIRLQITRILPHQEEGLSYKILENIRFPLRLGDDSFRMGEITFRNETKFIQLMLAFRTMLDLYEVDDVYGCATAALRDAQDQLEHTGGFDRGGADRTKRISIKIIDLSRLDRVKNERSNKKDKTRKKDLSDF